MGKQAAFFGILVLMLAAFFPAPSRAQVFKDVPEDINRPMELPPMETEQHSLPLYERCMLSPEPYLSVFDQRSLCACMGAREEELAKTAIPQYWTNDIRDRLVTPYEHFVTKILGPCLYIDVRGQALSQCLSQAKYRDLFADRFAFEDYCDCFALESEAYARSRAVPILEKRLADDSDNSFDNEAPVTLLMTDTTYRIDTEKRRQICIQKFGVTDRTNQ